MLFGVRMIPYGLRYMGEASVAIRRIQRLLMFEKFEASITSEGHVQHAVVLKNASFTHPGKLLFDSNIFFVKTFNKLDYFSSSRSTCSGKKMQKRKN